MVRQTVACLNLDPMVMPEFSMHPENFVDKIAIKFGGQDIDFDQHPTFSARYRVNSSRESELRRAFTPSLIGWIEQQPECCLEGTGRRVIWYHAGKQVEPDQLEQFVRDARGFFKQLLRS